MWKDTPWGPWEPVDVPALAAILGDLNVPWFIAGGYAIEAFAGHAFRQHDDIDFAVDRHHQLAVQAHLSPAWELSCADPPGTLRPWLHREYLHEPIHDIWAREDAASPWRFQLMLNDGDGDDWVYRRDARLRRPFAEMTFLRDGVRFLQPEVQLLFKSKTPRPKDEVDFETILPLLDGARRKWLAAALNLCDPGNEWLGRIEVHGSNQRQDSLNSGR